MKNITEALTPVAVFSFEQDLYHLEVPEQIAEDMVTEMMADQKLV